jgi:hypothetical protein
MTCSLLKIDGLGPGHGCVFWVINYGKIDGFWVQNFTNRHIMVMEWEYHGHMNEDIHGDMSHYITNNLQFGVMGGKWMAYGYKTYKTTNFYKDTMWLSWDMI